MIELVPLSALPPELVTLLVEQGGPTVGIVAILWWRISKLEERFSSRLDRLDDDVSANSSLIYDRLIGQEYPKPDRADQGADVPVESPPSSTSRSD